MGLKAKTLKTKSEAHLELLCGVKSCKNKKKLYTVLEV